MQNKLNTMHNKKLVWEKIIQGMADGEHSRSTQQCRVKVNNLKKKYRMIRDGNKISGNQRQEWEMLKLMAVSTAIRRHFVFNFRLRGYPA